MRIGLDARYLYTHFTGVGRYSYNLTRALVAGDDKYEYVIFKHRGYTDPIVVHTRFKELSVLARPVGPATLTTFGITLAREGIDLLHSHFPVAPLVRSCRSVITVHDLQPILVPEFSGRRSSGVKWAYDLFYRFAYQATIPRAAIVICGSKATAAEVCTLYRIPADRVRVIPYGIDEHFHPVLDPSNLALLRAKYGLPKSFILYVGNTRPHKNLSALLHGFARFAGLLAGGDAVLVLAGPKERFFADVQDLVVQLNLERQVMYLDYVDDSDLPALYSCARALALLSTKEGFGLPPLEAMACGTPVVVSTYGALPEVVSDAGLIVDPFDEEAVGCALLTLWGDEDVRRTLRQRGLARAAQYTWSEAARRTLAVYDEVAL